MRAIQLFCLGLVSLIWESLAECPCPLSLQFNPKTTDTIEECQFDISLANTSQVVETVICAPQENQCKLDTQTREVLNKFSFRAIARGDFGEIRSQRSADVKKDGKVQLHPHLSLQVEFDPQTKMAIKRCDFSVRCPGKAPDELPEKPSGSKCVYSTTGIPEEWENCSLSFVANGHGGKIHSEEFLLMFQDQPNTIVVTLKTAAMRRVTLEFSPQTELILKKCLFHVQCSNPYSSEDLFELPINNRCLKSIDIPESKDCFVHANAVSNQDEIRSENTSLIIDDNFRIRLVPVESTSSPDLELAPSEEDTIQDLHVTWTTSQLEVHFRGPMNATHCALELKSPETGQIRTHWFKAHDGQCNHVVSLPEPGGECLVKVITSDRSNRHIEHQPDNCFLRGPNLGLRFDVPSRWFALLTLYLVAFYPSIFESIG